MDRYDLLSPRKGKDDKTRWIKIGAMFSRDKGGFSIVLDALPLPDADGRVMLLASEPKEYGERPRTDSTPPQRRPAPKYDERNPPPDDFPGDAPF